MQKILNFIDGKWCEPSSAKWLDNYNPSTGKVFAKIPDSNSKDIDTAVAAAKKAFATWSKTTALERAAIMNKIGDGIEKRRREFAELESKDQGKPVELADKMDISRAILNFRFFSGSILHAENSSNQVTDQYFNYVLRKPIGVAGLISPWNLPLYLLTWKIAPAIACGNTTVSKPSEMTSMTAALFCEVLLEAGLPPGVVNIVFGTGLEAGDALVRHPQVPLISFTGGTATGRKVIEASAQDFKKLSLELGGKNPNIIFADCDLDKAVETTLKSSFLNQGEICLCGSRIYVEKSIASKFLEKFVAETKKLKVGDPMDKETFMGPVISQAHMERILNFIEIAKKEGGQILTGGKQMPRDGYFIEPTIITGLKENSTCIQEEIFGPVVTVSTFETKAEAIEKSNAVKYGLSASIWTSNLDTAHQVARELNVGTVWINSWLLRDLRSPFGGMKHSGIGREGGRHSLEFYSEMTSVNVRLES